MATNHTEHHMSDQPINAQIGGIAVDDMTQLSYTIVDYALLSPRRIRTLDETIQRDASERACLALLHQHLSGSFRIAIIDTHEQPPHVLWVRPEPRGLDLLHYAVLEFRDIILNESTT